MPSLPHFLYSLDKKIEKLKKQLKKQNNLGILTRAEVFVF